KQMLRHKKDQKSVAATPRNLDKFLGVRRFRYGKAEDMNRVGQVTGLAWTEVGGELLTIEAAVVPGKGKLQHTGQLGEVMQESIQAAMTVVRSRAQVLGLDPEFYQKDLVEIPDNIKGNLEIKAVKWIDEVLAVALTEQPKPYVLPEAPAAVAAVAVAAAADDKRSRRNGRRLKQVVPPAH